MIKINELQIGNWVDIPVGLKQVIEINGEEKVNKIFFDNVNPDGYFEDHLCHGIVITSEILQKCNAIKIYDNDEMYKVGELVLDKIDRSYGREGFLLIVKEIPDAKPIKYLHQLQNQYFDLTNEELKVQL